MVGERSTFRVGTQWIRWRADAPDRLADRGLADLAALSSRDLGECITDRRSSWVRRVMIGPETFYVKTYDYVTARDVIRGLGRTTAIARSRARREWDALAWLGRHGFARPDPIALLERRQAGFLRRAVLVTGAFAGEPIDTLVHDLPPDRRDQLIEQLGAFVARLHASGFRDRNLDLRNLIARAVGDTWTIAKLDSPRFRLRRRHRVHDGLAQRDLARLQQSMRAAGVSRAVDQKSDRLAT